MGLRTLQEEAPHFSESVVEPAEMFERVKQSKGRQLRSWAEMDRERERDLGRCVIMTRDLNATEYQPDPEGFVVRSSEAFQYGLCSDQVEVMWRAGIRRRVRSSFTGIVAGRGSDCVPLVRSIRIVA